MDSTKVEELNILKKQKLIYISMIILGVLMCVLLFFVSMSIGNYKTSLKDVVDALINPTNNLQVYTIIVYSRIPRIISAILVGAALSLSGFCFQCIFANKMASPDIIGVSSGASVGAVIAIILDCSIVLISLISFICGIIAVLLTTIIAKLFKGSTFSTSFLLSGIVVTGLMNSVVGIVKFVSNDAQLSSITFWLLGGFYNVKYEQLIVTAPIVLVCVILLILFRWKVVMLQNSDADVISHGINVKKSKAIIILLATLLTAISVSISGTIGWIGLAIPNLINLIVNNDSKKTMILSIIYGSVFALICDLLARTLIDLEIPIGIITGVLGAGIFIIVLIVRRVKNA